jgi:hypothetical protein
MKNSILFIILFTTLPTFAGKVKKYPISCSLIYLSDMADNNTMEGIQTPINLDQSMPADASGARVGQQTVHGFNVTVKMNPLIEGDKAIVHGYDLNIEIDRDLATSYSSTFSNNEEPFRRLSNIMGFGKEQLTVNCDMTSIPAPAAAPTPAHGRARRP